MNILYYDRDKYSYEDISETVKFLNNKGIEVIAIPKDNQLIIEASAEELFNLNDKIVVALDIIKEERPEEFRKAMKMRQYNRFREVIKKISHK